MQDATTTFLNECQIRETRYQERHSVLELSYSKSDLSAFQLQFKYLKFLHKRDLKEMSDLMLDPQQNDGLRYLC